MASLPQHVQGRIAVPAATEVRRAARDLVVFECARYEAVAGALMVVVPSAPPHLRLLASSGTFPDGMPAPAWLPLRLESPIVDTAIDGRVRLLTSDRRARRLYDLRLPPGLASLTLPLLDEADCIGAVALWLPTARIHGDRPSEAAPIALGPVSAHGLVLAQQLAALRGDVTGRDHTRRMPPAGDAPPRRAAR
jgi:hypothetical protein